LIADRNGIWQVLCLRFISGRKVFFASFSLLRGHAFQQPSEIFYRLSDRVDGE
jgi:hypothetical protein